MSETKASRSHQQPADAERHDYYIGNVLDWLSALFTSTHSPWLTIVQLPFDITVLLKQSTWNFEFCSFLGLVIWGTILSWDAEQWATVPCQPRHQEGKQVALCRALCGQHFLDIVLHVVSSKVKKAQRGGGSILGRGGCHFNHGGQERPHREGGIVPENWRRWEISGGRVFQKERPSRCSSEVGACRKGAQEAHLAGASLMKGDQSRWGDRGKEVRPGGERQPRPHPNTVPII